MLSWIVIMEVALIVLAKPAPFEKLGLESAATKDFLPLSCNGSGFGRCRPWSDVFQTLPIHMEKLVIPCGECVALDMSVVALFRGIDIQGKLLIDDRQDHVIQTTFIAVQGELEISAVGPVNGDPRIHIIMIGEADLSFEPINENSEACDGKSCTIGSKAIVVAGGRLNIRGISDDAPTWLLLHDATEISITTSSAAFGHWSEGSEIVIATHTTNWEENQVRKIVGAKLLNKDYVEFVLDRPIDTPTAAINSPDFATEVALLSRNVIIQAGYTSLEEHGGHLVIMQTPKVAQTIIGVDFQRFGQQGTLGRYPIHVHFCGDSKGTVIAKNTVRQSNQRCIVVHGTDNVEIRENVAYDTKGHCFMLEDGIETGNSFIRNIGIQTGAPAIIIPNYGFNGKETDKEPSTFWITNPSNNWIENTVAGSESSGFWFELLVRGERGHLYSNLDPKRESLGIFANNTVHSCSGKALRTYPSGYMPEEEATFVGVKVYLNRNTGVFFHNSKNLRVTDSLFADNRISIDIDRADNIKVDRTKFIGQSDSYRNVLMSRNLPSNCVGDNGRSIGLELHSERNERVNDGSEFRRLSFSGYSSHPCKDSVPVHVDDKTKFGYFDYLSGFEATTFDDESRTFDFCEAAANGVRDIYFVDSDGTFTNTLPNLFGTVISDEVEMARLVDPSNECRLDSDGCFRYCPGLCLRTVRFETDPTVSETVKLRICAEAGGTCFTYEGVYETDTNNLDQRHRYFSAHLPPGRYEADFVDNKGGRVWPSFADTHYERSFCPITQIFQVQLLAPSDKSICRDLIVNGDFKSSKTEALSWLYRLDAGVKLQLGAGMKGSPALVSGFNDKTTVGQYLDNRCFQTMAGKTYRVEAVVRFADRRGESLACDNGKSCAFIGINSRNSGFLNIGRIMDVPMEGGFFVFEGELALNGWFGVDDQVFFFIETTQPNTRLIVDHVSIYLP